MGRAHLLISKRNALNCNARLSYRALLFIHSIEAFYSTSFLVRQPVLKISSFQLPHQGESSMVRSTGQTCLLYEFCVPGVKSRLW